MSKAWYFDAHECTPCEVLIHGKLISDIEIRGRKFRAASSLIAETFNVARTGRMAMITKEIEDKLRQCELFQSEIRKSLNLLNEAIADDGVREDECDGS